MKAFGLSPSKIDVFFGCRRLFKYRYLKRPFPEPPHKAFLIGNIAHFALEHFYKMGYNFGLRKRPKMMKESFKVALTYYKDRKGFDELIRNKEMLEIRRMLQNFLDYSKSDNRQPEIIGIERSFEAKIGNVLVRGKIDRIDKNKEDIEVIDYKTSKIPMSTKEALAESVQLPLYAFFVNQQVDSKAGVLGKYLYLRNSDGDLGLQKFRINRLNISKAIEKVTRVDFELNHNCKFPRNTGYKFCGPYKCSYYQYCMSDRNDRR